MRWESIVVFAAIQTSISYRGKPMSTDRMKWIGTSGERRRKGDGCFTGPRRRSELLTACPPGLMVCSYVGVRNTPGIKPLAAARTRKGLGVGYLRARSRPPGSPRQICNFVAGLLAVSLSGASASGSQPESGNFFPGKLDEAFLRHPPGRVPTGSGFSLCTVGCMLKGDFRPSQSKKGSKTRGDTCSNLCVRKRKFILRKIFRKRFRRDSKDWSLPPALKRMAIHFLSVNLNSFQKPESGSVRLRCHTKVARDILREFPKAFFKWSFNGKPLAMDPAHTFVRHGNLWMNGLTVSDSGVYLCQICYKSEWKQTLNIYGLTVRSAHIQLRAPVHSTVVVQCNSETLGRMYLESTRQWSVNGMALAKSSRIPAEVGDPDRIEIASTNYTGVWVCSVLRGGNRDRRWETARLNVDVSPARQGAGWWGWLLDDPVHSVAGLVTVAGIGLVICVLGFSLKTAAKHGR